LLTEIVFTWFDHEMVFSLNIMIITPNTSPESGGEEI